MPRPFTFTLDELAKQHARRQNYLCFSVANIANKREPKFDEDGTRVFEYPSSVELICKFRKLMPDLFRDLSEVHSGENTVIPAHMTKVARMKNLSDPRRYLLDETIKVYGEGFQITLNIDENY